MLVVVALGGNALLRRGDRPDARTQELNISTAAQSIAALATQHDVVVTHGNGPQVGLLAAESEQDADLSRPYPLDVLGAETEGMVGYWLQRELTNAMPDRNVVTLLTQTVVDPNDPAFDDPTKFIGQVYDLTRAPELTESRGWIMKADGDAVRRVVPSPAPVEFVELPSIKTLLATGAIVVCAGGGGVPVIRGARGLEGVEAVIDKDRASAVLARAIRADALLMLTDVDAVQVGYGTEHSSPIRRISSHDVKEMTFPPGSMGPKIEAACQFVDNGGAFAGIGDLGHALDLLEGRAGTIVFNERLSGMPEALSVATLDVPAPRHYPLDRWT